MRILYYTPAPTGTGGYFRCFNLARHIAALGHSPSMVCADLKSEQTSSHLIDGVKVIKCPTSTSIGRFLYLDGVRLMRLIKVINQERPDVFHCFAGTVPSAYLAVLLGRLRSLIQTASFKIVVDWEDWWGRDGIWSAYNILFRTVGTFFEEMSPVLADSVTVVSDKLLERAIGLGIHESRIYRVPNGSDVEFRPNVNVTTARHQTSLPPDAKVICHMGYTHINAFRSLVRGFRQIKSPDVRLLLIGRLPPEHLRIASELGSRAMYLGQLPQDEAFLHLQASDILCLWMRDGIMEEARSPIRLGEYLAAGRPIIATDTGEVGRVLWESRCGIPLSHGDVQGFASACHRLLDDEALRRKMGERARTYASEVMAWKITADHLETVYERTLGGPN